MWHVCHLVPAVQGMTRCCALLTPGPPKDFEPIGAEQLSGPDVSSSLPHTQPPAEKRAPSSSSTAEAPAGVVDVDELRDRAEASKEGIKARVQVWIWTWAALLRVQVSAVVAAIHEELSPLISAEDVASDGSKSSSHTGTCATGCFVGVCNRNVGRSMLPLLAIKALSTIGLWWLPIRMSESPSTTNLTP